MMTLIEDKNEKQSISPGDVRSFNPDFIINHRFTPLDVYYLMGVHREKITNLFKYVFLFAI